MSRTSDYRFLDRLLHRFAFATWPIQAAMADIEGMVFRSRLTGVNLDRPVFVAGLPRAGTTLLLQLIEGTGEFAAYHYRDMPFLLTPLLWSTLSSSATRKVEARERAHGDGIAIDVDSPEAFEDVAWRALYPKKYSARSIEPWRGAVDPDKEQFLRAQMHKIVAIRSRASGQPLRYLSKCNGSIARFATICAMFPDSVILAPYRQPLDQARSLLRQHLNFLEMHLQDSFTREYMAAIGHYEFGANLKPINFSNWLDHSPSPDFSTLNGWIRYWCAAYGFLLEEARAPVRFLSYDDLCRNSGEELKRLEEELGLAKPGALCRQATQVRPQRPDEEPAPDLDPSLLRQATDLHERLEARRISGWPR